MYQIERQEHVARFRLLTFAERATWGACPICAAASGEPCRVEPHASQGDPHGVQHRHPTAHVETPGAAHYARLMSAPLFAGEQPPC